MVAADNQFARALYRAAERLPPPVRTWASAQPAEVLAGLFVALAAWALAASVVALAVLLLLAGAATGPRSEARVAAEVERRVDQALGVQVVALARREVEAETRETHAGDDLEVARYALSLCQSRRAAAADREAALVARLTLAREHCLTPRARP